MSSPQVLYRARCIIVILLAIAFASGCGSKPGPEEAAIAWWEAFTTTDRDKLSELTCAAKRDGLEMGMNQLAVWTEVFPSALGGILGLGELDAGVSAGGLKAETERVTGDTAVVSVSGRLRATVMGVSSVQEFSYPMRLVRENGEWLVCDDIIEAVVAKAVGGNELLMPLPDMNASAPQAVGTLTVDEAVRATVEAAQSSSAQATRDAVMAALPTATPSPTPLSEEAFARKVELGLARATAVASVTQKAVTAEIDAEFRNSQGELNYTWGGFSPDGKHAVATFHNYQSRTDQHVVWHTEDGRSVASIDAPSVGSLGPAVFSPDGQTLATAGVGGSDHLSLYKTSDWQLEQTLRSGIQRIEYVLYAVDGKVIVIGGRERIEFWDVETRKRIYGGAFESSSLPLISADGSTVVASSSYGIDLIRVPSAEGQSCLEDERIDSRAFSGDGLALYFVNEGKLYRMDLTSADCELTDVPLEIPGEKNPFPSRVAEKGGHLAIYATSATLWDAYVLLTRDEQSLILQHGSWHAVGLHGGAYSVMFHPNDKVLLALSMEETPTSPRPWTVIAWDVTNGDLLGEFGFSMPGNIYVDDLRRMGANRLRLSPDGSVLAVGAYDLQFWHLDEWLATIEKEH